MVKTEWTDRNPVNLLLRYTGGSYAKRSEQLARWVAESGCRRVFEVAAGCYDLARRIIREATQDYYVWTDADVDCVTTCLPYLRGIAWAGCLDACRVAGGMLAAFDALVCVSMEHLPCDVELVERAHRGMQVFLCGANFPSQWHVRHWESVDDMAARYPMLRIRRKLTMGPDGPIRDGELPEGCKFLLWGERRK